MQTEIRKSYSIRFSDQEKQFIETEALEAGQNFASFVRMRAMGSLITEAEQKLEAYAELVDDKLIDTLEQSKHSVNQANKVYSQIAKKYGLQHG